MAIVSMLKPSFTKRKVELKEEVEVHQEGRMYVGAWMRAFIFFLQDWKNSHY
jgi:hypothetical protein